MRVMKGRLGMDLSIMGLVLKTDGVPGQVGSPGYHGNHVKFESSLFKKRLTSPPLEIGPPTKIFDRHARYAYLYLYYSGFDTKSVEMQL